MPNVESLEQADGCRSRHRQQAVRCFHRAITERDFRVIDPLDSQLLHTPYRADDVENCIDRADFVQMQVIRRDTVDRALDGSDRLECRVSRLCDLFRDLHRIDQLMYLGHRSSVRLLRNLEVDFDAPHSRTLDIRKPNFYATQAKRRWQ